MSEEIFARHADVSLRRLRNDDADMALLLTWLTDPKVVARVWAEGAPWTDGKIRREFAAAARPTGTCGCIILHGEQPVGYLQFYPVRRDSYAASTFAQSQMKGAYGVDMFIGVPSLWRKGLGGKALAALEGHLRLKGVRCLCADPSTENEIGLRFWPKMGFDPLEVIEDYDDPAKQALLMLKKL